MKTILYLATTINGFIAKEDDSTSWSDEEWQTYKKIVNEAGVVIIGRKTYEIMKRDNSLDELECKIVVITNRIPLDNGSQNVIFFDDTPAKILDFLEIEGFTSVLIAGGSQINTLFMNEGLIDEIYLDVEPIVYGKGIPLFSPADFNYELWLNEIKKLSHNTIQLRYVLKNPAI